MVAPKKKPEELSIIEQIGKGIGKLFGCAGGGHETPTIPQNYSQRGRRNV